MTASHHFIRWQSSALVEVIARNVCILRIAGQPVASDRTAAERDSHCNPSSAAALCCHCQATAVTVSSPCSPQVLGRQLVQYAKHIGIRTINVVRRDEHIEELKALG